MKDPRCKTCNTPVLIREFVFSCPMCGDTQTAPIEARPDSNNIGERLAFVKGACDYVSPIQSYSGLESWREVEFESSTMKTPQFNAFTKDFFKELNKRVKAVNLTICRPYHIGHFEVSGFITDNTDNTGRYIYFSCSDVRFFRNEWYDHILIRTAKDDHDYTGGWNHYTTFQMFASDVAYLIERCGKDD